MLKVQNIIEIDVKTNLIVQRYDKKNNPASNELSHKPYLKKTILWCQFKNYYLSLFFPGVKWVKTTFSVITKPFSQKYRDHKQPIFEKRVA